MSKSIKWYISNVSNKKIQMKRKERLINSLNENNFYEIDVVDSDEMRKSE